LFQQVKINQWWVLIFIVCSIPRLFLALTNREANDDHAETVKLWILQQKYPEVDDCYECFQPPLYYAIVKAFTPHTDPVDKEQINDAMRWVNFVFGLGIVVLIFLVITQINGLSPNWQYLLALFWGLNPKLIAICAQMTNDAPIILLGLLFTYGVIDGIKHGFTTKILIKLLVIATLAPMVKGTGLLLIGTYGVLLGYLLLHKKIKVHYSGLLISGLSVLALIFIGYFGNYFHKQQVYGNAFITNWNPEKPPNFVALDTCKARLGITSVTQSYFTFRFLDLLKNPYLENGYTNNPLNRTSFFTLLYGQFSNVFYEQYPHGWKNRNATPTRFAKINYVLHIPLLLIFIYGLALGAKQFWQSKSLSETSFLLFVFLLFMLFLLKYSYTFRDFSFIKLIFLFPVLHALIYFFTMGIKPILAHKICNIALFSLISIICTLYLINLAYLLHTLQGFYS